MNFYNFFIYDPSYSLDFFNRSCILLYFLVLASSSIFLDVMKDNNARTFFLELYLRSLYLTILNLYDIITTEKVNILYFVEIRRILYEINRT